MSRFLKLLSIFDKSSSSAVNEGSPLLPLGFTGKHYTQVQPFTLVQDSSEQKKIKEVCSLIRDILVKEMKLPLELRVFDIQLILNGAEKTIQAIDVDAARVQMGAIVQNYNDHSQLPKSETPSVTARGYQLHRRNYVQEVLASIVDVQKPAVSENTR